MTLRGARAACGWLPRRGTSRARRLTRMKLAGVDRFRGSGVFAPWWVQDCVQHPCAGGQVARSLCAVR